jgi:dipeptidase D
LKFENAPADSVAVQVSVKGLKGGHSGLEIDKGRGNAIKIMNRVLLELNPHGSRLSALNGGNKRNAIPRECVAQLFVPKANLDKAKATVAKMNAICKAELATVEPDLAITLQVQKAGKGKVIAKSLQNKITQTIMSLPHGVLKMSADIPGLVETSTNVAVITTTNKAITMATSQRSSVASELDEAVDTVSAIFKLGGAKVENSDGYPGWKPNLKSPILNIAKKTYKQLYKKDPYVKAIHAGLECGIIGEKFPGMDMVSFGPTMEGVHSPDEKLHIDTVDKFWKFLLGILENWK